MFITYKNKKTEQEILNNTPKVQLKLVYGNHLRNKLIHGNNLSILKTLLDDYQLKGKIDLIYIDPPFSTNNCYKIGSSRSNTISMNNSDDIAYTDTIVNEYFLEFLRERLVLMREMMSEKASIYLHIDYKIGHYVKIIMDEIFGKNNFRNDITRIKCNPKNFMRKAYGNIKDMILFYSKSGNNTWNEPKTSFSRQDIEKLFKKIDENGRRYTTIPLHAPGETVNGKTGKPWRDMNPPEGRHWRSEPSVLEELDKQGLIEWSKTGVPRKKIYADEKDGKRMQDIWEFKDPQHPQYPTGKNLDLLKFIIQTSSNKGDLILDSFCGSGTTLVAAQELGRNWIGIDSSEHAIKITKKSLSKIPQELFADNFEYEFLEEKTLENNYIISV